MGNGRVFKSAGIHTRIIMRNLTLYMRVIYKYKIFIVLYTFICMLFSMGFMYFTRADKDDTEIYDCSIARGCVF